LHLIKTSEEPFYCFLSGGAGVGKSHVTKALYQAALKYYNTRRGQTTPLMFHEGYICLVYIFLNQVRQMSFLCSPVYFNLEVVTKCQIMTSPKCAIIFCKI